MRSNCSGAVPGREVQCADCEAWLEVPYLPRGGVWTRPRFRRTRGVADPGGLDVRRCARRGRGGRVLGPRLLLPRPRGPRRGARLDARLGRRRREGPSRGPAVRDRAALALLAADDARCADRRRELMARRDTLSVREAEGRIAAATKSGPDAWPSATCSRSRPCARTDRALEPLVPAILERSTRRGLPGRRRHRRGAAPSMRSGRSMPSPPASGAGRRRQAHGRTRALPQCRGRAAHGAGPAQLGVVIAQLPGHFTLGSPPAYEAAMAPIIAEALQRKGYAPAPGHGAGPAPLGPPRPPQDRLPGLRVARCALPRIPEPDHQVVTSLNFTRGSDVLWQANVTARTQVPLPCAAGLHRRPEHRRPQ